MAINITLIHLVQVIASNAISNAPNHVIPNGTSGVKNLRLDPQCLAM